MPVTTKRHGQKYRVVEADTRKLARNAAGTPLDGGGHTSEGAAQRQARAVNRSLSKK